MRAGALFRQPELAATLERIAADGPKGFYQGRTASLIAAQMRKGKGGLITAADLAGYKARWREPLVAQWRGMSLLTAPLPSSGGFALIELLEMHDALASQFAGLPHNSTQYVHLVAEIRKTGRQQPGIVADAAALRRIFAGDQMPAQVRRVLLPRAGERFGDAVLHSGLCLISSRLIDAQAATHHFRQGE